MFTLNFPSTPAMISVSYGGGSLTCCCFVHAGGANAKSVTDS